MCSPNNNYAFDFGISWFLSRSFFFLCWGSDGTWGKVTSVERILTYIFTFLHVRHAQVARKGGEVGEKRECCTNISAQARHTWHNWHAQFTLSSVFIRGVLKFANCCWSCSHSVEISFSACQSGWRPLLLGWVGNPCKFYTSFHGPC